MQVSGVPTARSWRGCGTSWRIIATPIVHAEYEGVRVTPNVYTTLEEIDTFAARHGGHRHQLKRSKGDDRPLFLPLLDRLAFGVEALERPRVS